MKFPLRCFVVVFGLALANPGLGDDSIKFKVRIQPRADFGDSQHDLYLRRSRLEASGRPLDGVNYVLAVAGDRWGQRGRSVGGDLTYAFVNYDLAAPVAMQVGLAKLPFVRSARVSSSRILFIERTKTANTAASALGPYITMHLAVHGRLQDSTIGYRVAVMDGFQQGDSDSFTGSTVTSAPQDSRAL